MQSSSVKSSFVGTACPGSGGYYFAYGSNMNPERVRQREMGVLSAEKAVLPGCRLVFNKRAADNPAISYANIAWDPAAVVEGVLYRLAEPDEILKMDPFEGAPRLYSREIFPVLRADGEPVAAWVYVANRAMISEGLRPARWYLQHLLDGAAYLSPAYLAVLREVLCAEDCEALF